MRQSQENLRAGYGVFFPQVSGSFGSLRQRFTAAQFGVTNAPGSIFSLFTASTTISYVLDVFGGQRRLVESLAAQADYQNYTALATYLTLLGNVVNAAIAQAAYRAEIEATQEIIGFQKEQLRLTEIQAQAGTVPYLSVVSLQAQLAATEATLPPLRQNLNNSTLTQIERLRHVTLCTTSPQERVRLALDVPDLGEQLTQVQIYQDALSLQRDE